MRYDEPQIIEYLDQALPHVPVGTSIYSSIQQRSHNSKYSSTAVDSTESSNKRKLDSHPEIIFEVEESVQDFFDRDKEGDMYSDIDSEDSSESEN